MVVSQTRDADAISKRVTNDLFSGSKKLSKYIAILFVAISATTVSHGPASGDDWPRFGGPTADFRINADSDGARQPIEPRLRWKRVLGPGMSGLVVSDELVYACHLDPEADQREVVVALDRTTGRPVWEQSYEAPHREQQQVFGGRTRSPQATPLIIGDQLVTIGFSGLMHAFDLQSGRIAWKRDLVQEFSAIPVQFGFSSSPIAMDGRLIVFAGGKDGGLVCLDVNDGKKLFNFACDEASYATPVVLDVEGNRQIVIVTRNEIIGIDANEGHPIWQYSLPKQGLTNVPTPLVTSDGGLIVSGQGIGGTAKLRIRNIGGKWEVDQSWFSTFQFFYCNWVIHHERVIGCEGDLLIAFDSKTGERLGRWRGFDDANVCLQDDRLVVIDGDGILSTLRINDDALTVETRHRLWKQRVWTPPTLTDNQLLSRGGDAVSCVDLQGGGSGEALAVEKNLRPRLAISAGTNDSTSKIDPIEKIIQAFDDGGVEAATKVYASLRKTRTLTVQDHYELADMAIRQGLTDMAKQIADDAIEDFSDDGSLVQIQQLIERLNRKPSAEVKRGDNGLDYIEFAIHNNTSSTLQTYVQGPKRHPFSYGIPFPPGKVRTEKWPVGTKLFRTLGDVRESVLLEVARKDAGKTIDLSRSLLSIRSNAKPETSPNR